MAELICSGYSALSAPNVVGWEHQPSWLVNDPVTGTVFALGEEAEGQIGVFRRHLSGWLLVAEQPSLGSHPCHAAIVGRSLLVAHYGDGVISRLDIAGDGTLAPARIVVDESDGAHSHCVTPYRANEVLVVDLGLAKVTLAQLHGDTKDWQVLGELALDVTTGPRHLVVHPSLPLAYLITEYSNEILTIAVGWGPSRLKVVDRRSTLPDHWSGTSFGSGVRLSPDGRFLLAGNRGHESLVSYPLDANGTLGPATHVPCGGSWPRDLQFSPDGTQVVVANQKSGWVSRFARNPANGALVPEMSPLVVDGAATVIFVSEPGSN